MPKYWRARMLSASGNRLGVGEGVASRIEDGRLPVSAIPMAQAIAVPPQRPQVEPRDRGRGVVPERNARREVQSEWGGLDQGGGQTQSWDQRRAYHGPRHGEGLFGVAASPWRDVTTLRSFPPEPR